MCWSAWRNRRRSLAEETLMSGSVARVTEISASSTTSFEDAISVGLKRATATLRNVSSAWIKEQKITLDDQGEISGFQVHMLITFVLDD
jgi:flavin-binding protein dodecin